MGFDTAYEAITEDSDTHRWAYGTGFTDPLAGVDTTVPGEVDGADLAAYCLMLGDDALIMSHRLQQWLSRAPELEEDTALANIALDLLGQARLLLSRAGTADGSGRTEDDFAFGRSEREFRNVRLAEISDADFAGLMARLLVFSTWRLALLADLRESADPVLAAIAAQGVKEVTYHRDYAAQWVVRLGDGTDYSRERMVAGLAAVAPFVAELFAASAVEQRLPGVAVDPAGLRTEFDDVIATVFTEARLAGPDPTEAGPPDARSAEAGRPGGGLVGSGRRTDGPAEAGRPGAGRPVGEMAVTGLVVAGQPWPGVPGLAGVSGQAGRGGVHTEAMGYLLAELQSVARSLPGATW